MNYTRTTVKTETELGVEVVRDIRIFKNLLGLTIKQISEYTGLSTCQVYARLREKNPVLFRYYHYMKVIKGMGDRQNLLKEISIYKD